PGRRVPATAWCRTAPLIALRRRTARHARRVPVPHAVRDRDAWIMAQTVLFSRYRLLEPVGTGGSAEVWRALDTKTGDEVAVKRLHPIVVADAAGRARLRGQCEALRPLDEPHIVRVRDLHVGKREAALILDYVPGQSLAQRLATPGQDRAAALTPEAAALSVRA